MLRGCRCVEIDVWDGDAPSDSEDSSSSESEAEIDPKTGKKPGLKDRLKAKIARKTSKREKGPHPVASKKEKENHPVANTDGTCQSQSEMPKPWRANSNRAEPKVYHGTVSLPVFPADLLANSWGVKATLPLPISLFARFVKPSGITLS